MNDWANLFDSATFLQVLTWKKWLKQLIIENSFSYSDTPKYRLVSGGLSNFYFDCKRTTLLPQGQYLIGNIFFSLANTRGVNQIGGLTLGADAIATATAYTSHFTRHPVNAFIIRKKVKDHGTKKSIEGCVDPNLKVIVIDDVITTGGSTIQAIESCLENGLQIDSVIALIDRQEMNGLENIQKYVGEVISIFKANEFIN